MRYMQLLNWMSLLVSLSVLILSPFIFIRFSDVQQHQNDALRTIICRAEHFIRTAPNATPQQKHQALSFYEDALAAIHAKACQESN